SLAEILQTLRARTNLKISKLNDRYYTLSKEPQIEFCAQVVDYSEQKPIPNATVEVEGTNIHLITDQNGYFELTDIPANAYLTINHLGYKTQYLQAQELIKKEICNVITVFPDYQEL